MLVSPLLSITLPIAEVFTSDQAGTAMTFVRLAGPYDTGYYRDMTLFEIASFIPPQIRHVCITGGEPTVHGDKLWMLLAALTSDDKTIHLETSGAIDPPDYMKSNEHICWAFKS